MTELAKTAAKSYLKKKAVSYLMKSPLAWGVLAVVILLGGIVGTTAVYLMAVSNEQPYESGDMYGEAGGTANVSPEVSRWEPLIRKYAKINGIEEYVGLILALIQQESGGRHLDVMQSSESIGLPPGTITDPEFSIEIGVRAFADVLKKAKFDIKLTLQSYNFGSGFISYAQQRGGYSKPVVVEFSRMMAQKQGWPSYGDVDYVDHVLRYYSGSGGENVKVIGAGGQSFDVKAVLTEMEKYLGLPYVWGGRTPAAGGFDCSGLMEYAFNKAAGKDLYGNAQSQYNKTVPVPDSKAKPGDLIFFSTYKPGASHVGMYVGSGKFINANDGGIEYSSVATWKKLYPYLGIRRVK